MAIVFGHKINIFIPQFSQNSIEVTMNMAEYGSRQSQQPENVNFGLSYYYHYYYYKKSVGKSAIKGGATLNGKCCHEKKKLFF